MSDLIRREDAIDALLEKGQSSRRYKIGEIWELNFDEIREALATVPSAEPEQKVGHWVYKDGVRGFGIGAWCCSECGEENESLPFHKCRNPYEYGASRYCACCGAMMEGNHETD